MAITAAVAANVAFEWNAQNYQIKYIHTYCSVAFIQFGWNLKKISKYPIFQLFWSHRFTKPNSLDVEIETALVKAIADQAIIYIIPMISRSERVRKLIC